MKQMKTLKVLLLYTAISMQEHLACSQRGRVTPENPIHTFF